jgi:hypothetical protein
MSPSPRKRMLSEASHIYLTIPTPFLLAVHSLTSSFGVVNAHNVDVVMC